MNSPYVPPTQEIPEPPDKTDRSYPDRNTWTPPAPEVLPTSRYGPENLKRGGKMAENVNGVTPGNPIYYDPKRIRRKKESDRRNPPPEEKRRKRETALDQVDTYA
jgi:hypothetical protein